MLSATYRPDAGELACRGEISVSVEITCFWTFDWEDDVELVLDAPEFKTIQDDVTAHHNSLE